jgi:hypothetical protein
MASIMAALVSSNDGVRGGKKVDDLGFSLVTPLGTYYNGDSH